MKSNSIPRMRCAAKRWSRSIIKKWKAVCRGCTFQHNRARWVNSAFKCQGCRTAGDRGLAECAERELTAVGLLSRIDASAIGFVTKHSRWRAEKPFSKYAKAAEIDPTFGKAYYALGLSYIKSKQNDKACLSFQQAQKLNYPGASDAVKNLCN